MNITMNSAPLPTSTDTVAANGAPADALPLDPAQLAASGVPAVMPFLQFMDLNAAAMPAGEQAVPELAAADAPAPQDGAAPAPVVAETAEEVPAAGNDTLLAAMAMPLMPSMMMAMPAALPAGLRFASGKPEQQGTAGSTPLAAAAATAGTAGATGAVELALAAAATPLAKTPDAAFPAQATDSASIQLARASTSGAQPAPAAASAASQPAAAAVQAQPREAAAAEAVPAAGGNAGFVVAAPSVPNAPVRDGGTLALAGPPTAWRQSLQEALGERLNVQLTKNAEQAVIRLEPPMLGRVEISIRHSAGALEVNITATHSEVLRQLNTVSDNLRSDLAGRQYTDVSVNVSQAAPRAQAVAQAGTGAGSGAGSGADSQGRSQKGEDQDERAPGAALAEAHQSTTAFSLSSRA